MELFDRIYSGEVWLAESEALNLVLLESGVFSVVWFMKVNIKKISLQMWIGGVSCNSTLLTSAQKILTSLESLKMVPKDSTLAS